MDNTNKIVNTLANFQPITLSEMDNVKLLDRLDSKYIFHIKELDEILKLASQYYNALTINGKLYAQYETHYFDTNKFDLYHNHHNKRLNRNKIRIRSYVDSDLHFFEIKRKNNKGRTKKSRLKLSETNYILSDDAKSLIVKKTDINPFSLQDVIQINYNRITLVNKELTERLTIDFGMTYIVNGIEHSHPNLVIAEIKQDRNSKSHFIHVMRLKRIMQTSLSKYCFGIANYIESVKKNNFKTKMLYVKKICKL